MAKKEKKPITELASRQELLNERVSCAVPLLEQCTLCPRKCNVNRLQGERGFCGVGFKARVASYGPHFGEESVLVGKGGSGAIFFSGCNLQCVFCQNEDISIPDPYDSRVEEEMASRQLAKTMLELQERGCANINLVTPSHVVPQILSALQEAVSLGLSVPIVYNSSGYDLVETLKLLDGVIDVYMPDCKFWSAEAAGRYLQAKEYPQVAQQAIAEMHRQVGDLVINEKGEAVRGLLVRHLVMPGLLEETEGIMKFLADTISRETYINVMDQYRPCYRAGEFPEINRSLLVSEHNRAMELARKAGLHRLEKRDLAGLLALLFK